MTLASLLVHVVTVSRVTRTPDGAGGWTEARADVYVDVPCRVQPLTAEEIGAFGTVEAFATHRIYLGGTADIRADDRLTFGARTFLVAGPARNIDELDRLVTVDALET